MAGAMVGRVFNSRYKITERIGIGGMAEVYAAQDTVLGRTVAVKVMLPQYAENAEFSQRFKQEAASAANLQSPYIVNIYDWGQDNGTYYIVMEYVRGVDLKSGIKARGALNQRKVAEIGAQVCSALSVAHKQDIIHRDIKPQNIMVQPDGNIKVMDFGIARAKNSVKDQTSSVLGTAHYISPEQAQGKELTSASDIYSLGIVLYEAATGKLPFDGPDAVSVATMQVNQMPAYPSEVNPLIDPQLESIIMRAMDKNPRNRFATANDMRQALNDYLSGRKTAVAVPASSSETAYLGTGVRAAGPGLDKTSVMPVTGVNTGTGTGTTSTGKGTSYRGNNEEEEDEKKNTTRRNIIIGAVAAVVAIALIAFIGINVFGGKSETAEVPDVTGKSVTEATSILKNAGFEVGTTDKSYDSSAASGTVISQDPAAGKQATQGSKINLVVSLGAEEVLVPDLSKMTADEAKAALDKVGLVASAGTAEYSADVDVNHVVKQSPAAGSTAKKGDTVTYILSLGTENISVPAVVGFSQDSATSTLKNAGFEVSVTSSYSSTVDNGIVISQDPSSGKLEKGGTVTINVSAGPDPASAQVDIPNVVGKTVAEAKSSLGSAGFSVSIDGPTDDTAVVTAQSPTGSTKKGSTITLTTASADSGTDEKTN